METKDRKFYLDNLRWITILVVVVFHIFYYYNDVGAEPMFQGIPQTTGYTFPALFQYGVYQWFMMLLFIVSGICARFTLEKKSTKEFFKDKVNKLLAVNTLLKPVVGSISIWTPFITRILFRTEHLFILPQKGSICSVLLR